MYKRQRHGIMSMTHIRQTTECCPELAVLTLPKALNGKESPVNLLRRSVTASNINHLLPHAFLCHDAQAHTRNDQGPGIPTK